MSSLTLGRPRARYCPLRCLILTSLGRCCPVSEMSTMKLGELLSLAHGSTASGQQGWDQSLVHSDFEDPGVCVCLFYHTMIHDHI